MTLFLLLIDIHTYCEILDELMAESAAGVPMACPPGQDADKGGHDDMDVDLVAPVRREGNLLSFKRHALEFLVGRGVLIKFGTPVVSSERAGRQAACLPWVRKGGW